MGKVTSSESLQIVDAMGILSELDAALESVDKQRDSIIALHQQVMHKVSPSLERGFESYEERQLAHAMMRNPRRPLDLDAFSQGMRIQSMHAEKMMDAVQPGFVLVIAFDGVPRGKGHVGKFEHCILGL